MNRECNEIRDLIADSVTESLSAEQARCLDEHLTHCDDCRRYAEALHREDRLLDRLASELAMDMPIRRERLTEVLSRHHRDRQTNHKIQGRRIMVHSIARTTVAVAAVTTTLVAWQYVGRLAGTGITFARAVRPILDANTAVMDVILGTPEPDAPVMHDMVKGSRIRRTYSNVPDVVAVIDMETWQYLTLTEVGKRAIRMDIKGPSAMPDFLGELRAGIVRIQSNAGGIVENLGTMQIDGRDAVGFLARQPPHELTIWADPQTGSPVRIEYASGSLRVTMTNVQFDVPLEDSLFSMEAPDGYTRHETKLDLDGATEANFVEGLRILIAFAGDGRFPDSVAVEDFMKLVPALREKRDRLGMSGEERTAQGIELQKYLAFMASVQAQGSWQYRGAGVALGAAETPIFWYQPKGSATYRVIYADLSVHDLPPEELPE